MMKLCSIGAKCIRKTVAKRPGYALVLTGIISIIFLYLLPHFVKVYCKHETPNKSLQLSTNNISQETMKELKKEWLAEQKHHFETVSDHKKRNSSVASSDIGVKSIDCIINDGVTIQCLQSDLHKKNEIYLPFSFVEKYIDAVGNLKKISKGNYKFEVHQSHAKAAFLLATPHTYYGPYMATGSQMVEYRDRVRCVSGIEGVPVSTQWSDGGYFYAIQIAQFGLSYYSKILTEKSAPVRIFENAESGLKKWKYSTNQKGLSVKVIADKETSSQVVHFFAPKEKSYVVFRFPRVAEKVLSFDVKFVTNGLISLVCEDVEKMQTYRINYVTTNDLLQYNSSTKEIFYGIGKTNSWTHISRDLVSDFERGIGNRGRLNGKTKIRVNRIMLQGEGFIDNITTSKAAHLTHFNDAVNWMINNQDQASGGWKNQIVRKFKHGVKTLKPGWISAMGQGQAISLLSRAYYTTGNKSFIKAISRALKPYTIPSEKGGVKAVFLSKYIWYEEYPTTPSSFVLNGFMYSVLGLYDYKSLLEDKFKLNTNANLLPQDEEDFRSLGIDLQMDYKLTCRLYDEGMTSLKALLPLYDGGSRTFYDLNHFMHKVLPNVARWDYHTLHLRQLAVFYSITKDPIFKRYFEYWDGYTKGKFAPHN